MSTSNLSYASFQNAKSYSQLKPLNHHSTVMSPSPYVRANDIKTILNATCDNELQSMVASGTSHKRSTDSKMGTATFRKHQAALSRK